MDQDRIRALQSTSMFGAIDDTAVAFLLERAELRSVSQGECFFEQGEEGGSAFLLERGEASVIKVWKGQEHRLRRLGAGDCFGEVALLDFGPRSATIRADQDCRAIELHARDLRALAKANVEQFALVYMNLGRELSRRLRDADDRLFRTRVEFGELEPAADYDFTPM